MKRVQEQIILKDIQKRMVFLVGPRQSGKTWLSKKLMSNFQYPLYLSYDNIKDREIIHTQGWAINTDFLILDELHKMPNWKNFIKGVYDTKPDQLKILITGSAQLDVYESIGDSLVGRYFRHRLLPISIAEGAQVQEKFTIMDIIEKSGFPEPLLLLDLQTDVQRWRQQYVNGLLSNDVFDVGNIINMKAFRQVFELLRIRVGSPLSYQSLAHEVGIASSTVKAYVDILEAVYLVFRILPYSYKIARSILKEPKIYFFDTGLVSGGEGEKFENLLAISLLKHVYYQQDILGKNINLSYLRTKDGEKVDFALVEDQKVKQIIEAKLSDTSLSKSLYKFNKQYGYPASQVVLNVRHSFMKENIGVKDAFSFLKNLSL